MLSNIWMRSTERDNLLANDEVNHMTFTFDIWS